MQKIKEAHPEVDVYGVDSIEEAVKDKDVIVLATASKFIRSTSAFSSIS